MAPEFRLNLIRMQVPSPLQRRTRYGAMVAYLAVSGALLAIAIGVTTTWLIQAAERRTELAQMSRAFADTHRAESGIMQYAARLEKELTGRIAVLKSADGQLAGRPRLGQVLYRLGSSLPPDVALRSLALQAGEDGVSFELLVPGSRVEAGMGPSDMVTQWNQDAGLGECLTGITYVASQRQMNGDRSDVIWHFSGHLVRKGT